MRTVEFECHPVTAERLDDLRAFSEAHGKFRWCSCMRWRLSSSEFKASTKTSRIAALEDRVREGVPVGVLAYAGGVPVGWCSVAPRATYAALERSRKLARIDDEPVWSITCFFIDAKFRRRGCTEFLLAAAAAYAHRCGARVVEGYPVPPNSTSYTYMGSPATFGRAGFENVTPEGRDRLVMRRTLGR